MSITHVDTQFGTPNTSSSPALTQTSTVTKPTGLAIGDVMIAILNLNEVGSLTKPSANWNLIVQNDSVPNIYRFAAYYCVATSIETAASNFVWTNGDAAAPIWAAISAYRGVDQNNPINTYGINASTTSGTLTCPSVTTSKSCLILRVGTVKKTSGTTLFSSSVTNERFDNGNHDVVSYQGALYDSGSETAGGSSGTATITAGTSSSISDGLAATIALTSADTSVTAGVATATVSGKSPTTLTGVAVTAGVATATASAKQASALVGQIANAGVAAVTASAKAPTSFARPSSATATAAAFSPMLFFGTPGYRTKVVPDDDRTLTVSQD